MVLLGSQKAAMLFEVTKLLRCGLMAVTIQFPVTCISETNTRPMVPGTNICRYANICPAARIEPSPPASVEHSSPPYIGRQYEYVNTNSVRELVLAISDDGF